MLLRLLSYSSFEISASSSAEFKYSVAVPSIYSILANVSTCNRSSTMPANVSVTQFLLSSAAATFFPAPAGRTAPGGTALWPRRPAGFPPATVPFSLTAVSRCGARPSPAAASARPLAAGPVKNRRRQKGPAESTLSAGPYLNFADSQTGLWRRLTGKPRGLPCLWVCPHHIIGVFRDKPFRFSFFF